MDNTEEQRVSKATQEKNRNDANNAKNIKAAANIAQKSGNPYAKAAGTIVNAADKVSGGKASERLGQALTKANKLAGAKGKLAQKALNKASESGATDKLNQMSNKNSNGKAANNSLKNAQRQGSDNLSDKLSGGKNEEVMDEASNGTASGTETSLKFIKTALILLAPVMIMIMFCCVLIASSQLFLKAIGLGNADLLGTEEADKKINKKIDEDDEDLDKEVEEDDLSFDIFIDDKAYKFANNKLKEANLVQTSSKNYIKRKYNEADLSDIEDFYPAIINESKNYDENLVYDFYFKMYNLYILYRDNYNVYLDLPLLMATLNLQSDDPYEVFSSNLSAEDRKKTKRKDYSDMDYYYDWTSQNYVSTKTISTHDMEILAQNMVNEADTSECEELVNGKCYIIDNEKYREFLEQFIEKKYYLDEEVAIESGNNNSSNNSSGNNLNGDWRSWTQCGQSWSNLTLPNSNYTMCQSGCLVTSIAIQIARSNVSTIASPFDPGIALDYFSFIDGGLFVFNSTTSLAPSFKYYSNLNLLGMKKTDIANKLNSFDSSKYYIVLSVSRLNESKISHYVALDYIDTNNSNIYMIDPVSTDYKELYAYYKLYGAYIYVKEG